MVKDIFKAEEVSEHFDRIAESYDFWKEKNWYYYDELKRIASAYSAGVGSILDAGCGTGTILSTLRAPKMVGMDVSPEMIAIARKRFSNVRGLSFFSSDIVTLNLSEKFDLILAFDIIEHLSDQPSSLKALSRTVSRNGRIVLTMANPVWEPILLVAEKIGQKMPEGPHNRISAGKLIKIAEDANLRLVKREWRLIFPKYLPFVSYFMNRFIARIPVLKRLCFIEVFIFSLKEDDR